MAGKTYRRVVLANRPAGEPAESDFRIEEVPIPEIGEGQFLVRIIYMSLDPYMRGRMREAPSYAAFVELGATMTADAVGEIVESRHPGYRAGEVVVGRFGWQEYAVGPVQGCRKFDPSVAPISTAIGVLGMTGLTAYLGLFRIGRPAPDETVLVSAASGAVGQVVGQLARIAGCRAVGIAGGATKCAFVTDELGFDACVDYKAGGDLAEAVRVACPDGVDVYFENVGGPVGDAAYRNLNTWSRVVLCGTVSQYNATEPGPRLIGSFVGKRVTAQGFIVWDFEAHYAAALKHLAALVRSGQLKYREDISQGIENAPRTFIGMLRGENFGKTQVQLGPDPFR
jgi:NADPH-dependent curcumin reductase CurA